MTLSRPDCHCCFCWLAATALLSCVHVHLALLDVLLYSAVDDNNGRRCLMMMIIVVLLCSDCMALVEYNGFITAASGLSLMCL